MPTPTKNEEQKAAFASAGVVIPNEVIPIETQSNGIRCPRLNFGHKVIEEILSKNAPMHHTFTAKINSIAWAVNSTNMNLLQGAVRGSKSVEKITMEYSRVHGLCAYTAEHDGTILKFTLAQTRSERPHT